MLEHRDAAAETRPSCAQRCPALQDDVRSPRGGPEMVNIRSKLAEFGPRIWTTPGQELAGSGPNWVDFGPTLWPTPVESGVRLAVLSPTLVGPKSGANVWPNRGANRPKAVEFGPKLDDFGPNMVTSARHRSTECVLELVGVGPRSWSKAAKSGRAQSKYGDHCRGRPNSVRNPQNCGQSPANFARHRTNSIVTGQCWPKSATILPKAAHHVVSPSDLGRM